MGSEENLLSVEPQELKFNVEVGKQSSCTIRLINSTKLRVAFKVMTTNPEKYCVRPNVGIVSPKSSLDLNVIMRAPTETPINMQCKDKFLIKSIAATSADSIESARKMFNDTWRPIFQCKLKVVYNTPSDRPLYYHERSGTVYPPPDTSRSRNLNVSEGYEQDRNKALDLFMKTVTFGLLVLASCYLIIQILPFIWTLTLMLSMLVIRMVKRLVSDQAEDWIVKILLSAFLHYSSVIYNRLRNNNENRRSQ